MSETTDLVVCGFEVADGVRYIVERVKAVGKTYRLWRVTGATWDSIASFRRESDAMQFLADLTVARSTGELRVLHWAPEAEPMVVTEVRT